MGQIYTIEEQTLTNIANAIRQKKSSDEEILVEKFATEIINMPYVYDNVRVTSIPYCGFYHDKNISGAFCPEVTVINAHAFNTSSLKEASFPKAKEIYNCAFQNTYITELTLPAATYIGDVVFSGSSLEKLILSGTTVCTLNNVSSFTDTPIASGTGFIYVPENLVSTYKAAGNWSSFASQIKSINSL